MKTHEIKLREVFCDDVYLGKKSFEIRKNDRNYQVGDRVKFLPVDCDGNRVKHPIEGREYIITYVLYDWGVQYGYVAFAIKELPKELTVAEKKKWNECKYDG